VVSSEWFCSPIVHILFRTMGMVNGASKVHVPRPALHFTAVIDVLKSFGFSVRAISFVADGKSSVVGKGKGIPY
jgi:hypothetical protein